MVLALATSAPASAAIRPGSAIDTPGVGQCTGNFIFTDAADLYIGYAAHCAEHPDSGDEYCRNTSLAIGTPVTIEGATRPGRLAYSSWAVMTAIGEADIKPCNANDFALVRIDPADHDDVDPTVPFWGGPTGLRRTGVATGEKLLSYGNSGLRLGIEPLKPREGYLTTDWDDGWDHWVHFVTPGIWGDSGSGVMDASGSATGVLVTLNTLQPGGNGVSDLAKMLDYMEAHGGPDVRLVLGRGTFTGPKYGPGVTESPPPTQDPEPAPQAAPDPAPQSSSPPEAPRKDPAEPRAEGSPSRADPQAAPRRKAVAKKKAKRCPRKSRSRSSKARAKRCRQPTRRATGRRKVRGA